MQSTGRSPAALDASRLAPLVSHVLTPVTLVTLLLLTTPLRHAQASWGEALIATAFTTLIPWLVLVAARLRGRVSDLHVTQRKQRHWLHAFSAGSIACGLLLLWLLHASGAMFREVLAILLGLAMVAVINLWWKVSVHLAVGSYVALQVADGASAALPLVVAGIALLSWARIRSGQHTASQTCAGVLIGVGLHYANSALGVLLA